MIIDNIKNASKYYCLGRDFENALKFMLNCNEIVDEPVILNERIAIKPSSYTTRNETDCVFEAHKLYADIQFVVNGSECIGYSPTDRLKITSVNDEKDLILLDGKGVNMPLEKGDFMILFPDDAHMVGVRNGEFNECVKLVAKILL